MQVDHENGECVFNVTFGGTDNEEVQTHSVHQDFDSALEDAQALSESKNNATPVVISTLGEFKAGRRYKTDSLIVWLNECAEDAFGMTSPEPGFGLYKAPSGKLSAVPYEAVPVSNDVEQSDDEAEGLAAEEATFNYPAEYKFVDWGSILKNLGIIIVLFGFMGFCFTDSHNPQTTRGAWTLVTILGLLFAVPNIIINFKGYAFDRTADNLSYPWYGYFRRKVALSQIQAANAETVRSKTKSDWGRVVGESKPQTHYHVSHQVNLSGAFGLRRLKFGSRGRRDEFLATLRDYAPHARITRWT